VVEKDPLITYESVIFSLLSKADAENVSGSTVFFERKLMSTKTTFKRVAAVAAAALAISGFSAVSAHAADALGNVELVATSGDSFKATNTAGNSAATAVAGAANSISFTLNTSDLSGSYTGKTGGAGIVVVSGGSSSITAAGTEFTLAAGTAPTSATIGDSKTTNNAFTVSTPVVGTITVSYYKLVSTGIYSATATESITVTVNAASVVGTVSVGNSKSYITDSATVTGHTTASDFVADSANVIADSTVLASKSLNTDGTAKIAAVILVTLKDTQSPTAGLMTSKKLSASISGPGLVMGNDAANAALGHNSTVARAAVAYTSSSDAVAAFGVYSDGTSGVGTVTISYTDANLVTTVISTETVTFYGGVSAITPTVGTKYVASSGSAWPTSLSTTAYAVKLKFTDSAGNLVTSAQTITAKSSDTNKISSSSCSLQGTGTKIGYYFCTVTGVSGASGAATVTYSVGSASAGTYVSTTADFVVSSVKAATLVFAADSTVAAGQVITYTITAKDSAGNPIPDGSLACDYIASSPLVAGGALVDNGANGNNVKDLFGCDLTTYTADTAVKFVAGVATDSVQAPFGTSTIATEFTNKTATASSTVLAVALSAVVTDLSTAVTGDPASQAATDAAQEATDAANAAYDAANNAMDSADAATAAAQDASDNASAALAAVTSLSATVAKLVASVSAITSALASIKKKLGVK
jgi:hypothetical protein